MFHLAAYSGSVSVTTNTDIAAVTDSVLSQRNNHYVPGVPMAVMAAYGLGANVTNWQMLTPKINAITPIFLVPADPAATPTEFRRPCDFRRRPFALNVGEELQFKETGTMTAATQVTALAWLQLSHDPAPIGEQYNLRGTATTAAVANTWTLVSMTWQNSLPAGLWAVIGGAYYATHAVAFRIAFPGQVWRPGGMGYATEPDTLWQPQLDGGLGLWGTFPVTTLPNVEVFNTSTDNSHVIYLSLIKVG